MPPKKLDSGGQGQIYEVDKDTVYKVIKFSDHYKEISELAILHSLQHPCMIKMKKYELNRNECKIYMERMYMNMYDFAKKNSFEKRLEVFPNLFWTMVRVARFFQRNGIMNCDIKTENVMISKDGKTIKIIDFGHIISEENYPIIGTRSYQPPELWLDDKYYSTKSMVWSIGITALEFLYRIHPIVDIIYGEDSESESSSDSKSKRDSKRRSKQSSRDDKDSYGSSDNSDYYTDSNESDEYRQRYINLFEILMEEGESLAFRHRLEQPHESIKDKSRVINNILERMLTYDYGKRISLDELYHHRIFNNIRGNIQDEPIVCKSKDQLYCDREYTMLFLNVGRKLYRDEILVQSYTLLSYYLEKIRNRPSRQEFFVISMACMDIMSYTFSMVPSSRDLYRKVILRMKNITEDQIFDKAIEISKQVQFNLFYNGILDVIQQQDHSVFYSLLLELIEHDAECGKKTITIASLLSHYFSSSVLGDEDENEEDEKDNYDQRSPPNRKQQSKEYVDSSFLQSQQNKVVKPESVKPESVKPEAVKPEAVKPEAVKPESVKPEAVKPESVKPVETKPNRKKGKETSKEITENDIDQNFLTNFKEHIRMVHQQEIIKKREEEDQGDILVIEL